MNITVLKVAIPVFGIINSLNSTSSVKLVDQTALVSRSIYVTSSVIVDNITVQGIAFSSVFINDCSLIIAPVLFV
jgi:hypothetical protein